MKKTINIKDLAIILATKKVENKFRKSGYSPYNNCYDEYVGVSFTEDAQKLFDKEYEYFLNTIKQST